MNLILVKVLMLLDKRQTAEKVHEIYNLIPLELFVTNKSVAKKCFPTLKWRINEALINDALN